ncbi:MAG: efflux RND transporter periplasmic adaptor subunit [Phycisphaerales bacterium]|nr:MAG: efflux RND transporter periplasmic adaptor subunit [Phycisphaerales bacterium]
MKTLLGVVALSAVVGALFYLNDITKTEDGKSILHVARELEVPVDTARPQQRGIVRTVQAPGEVEAFAEVDISSELVSKIIEMPVEEGDEVQKDDLLCRLDDADYKARALAAEANVGRLKALVKQSEADLAKAQRDWDRQKRLSEANATSTLELADYHTALLRAQAALDMTGHQLAEAEAAFQAAREDLAKTVISAPMGGVVSQLFAEQGEVVVTGTMNNPGTRIMVVSDLSKMQVRCRVDESDAPLVAPGQNARIYLQSDTRKSIAGEVLRVATKGTKLLGRDVVTFETRVLITGDDPRVKPGMTANLEIEVAQKEDAVTVPVEAVVYRKRRDLPEDLVKAHDKRLGEGEPGTTQNIAQYIKLVFCVDDGGKAEPRLVETGISDATKVEITEGLALVDTVIVGPYRSLDQLKAGSPLKINEPDKEKQPDKDESTGQDGDESPAQDNGGDTVLASSQQEPQASTQSSEGE